MSTIIKLEPVARRSVTGDSNGPQGADGTAVLAREAYMAMLAAEWEADEAPASMPVHEFKRGRPAGQAFKAVWGYDATARSQLSCCGAECYTYRIPSDALDATNPDGVADVESVSVRLAGDRYLDRGVCLWCELSSSPTPSPLAVAIASGDGVGRLAAQNQTDADGSPIAPNKRSGAEETVALDMGSAAPAVYIHIYLYLADYLGVRGGWIEGGAMFADEAADVAFSRDVFLAETDSEAGTCALDIGRLPTTTAITPEYALQHMPRASLWENFTIYGDNATNGVMDDEHAGGLSSTFDMRVKDLLAFLFSDPSLWAQSDMVALSATIAYAQKGLLKFTASTVGFCCLCAHGLTNNRIFRGLRFENAIPDNIPYRLLVYGISSDLSIASSASGSSLHFATPLAYWADILSRSFRAGTAQVLRVMTDSGLSKATTPTATDAETADVAVSPLAARDVSSQLSRVDFDAPFKSGEFSSVILALIPNGAPSGTTEQSTTINATATRSLTATIPISAKRQSLTTLVSPTGTIYIEVASSIRTAISAAVSGAGVSGSGNSATWNSKIMGMPATIIKEDFSTAAIIRLYVSFTYGGKTFTYDTNGYDNPIGDPAISASWKVSLFLYRPSNNSSELTYTYSLISEGKSFNFVAHAADGSTLPVTATFKPNVISLIGTGGSDEHRHFGYLYPSEWASANNNFGRNFAVDGYTDLIDTTRATLAGFVYSFSNAANETAVATVTQSGTITFTRNGTTYTAPYSVTSSPTLGVGSKTTGTRIIVGNDTTETGTVFGNVHEISQRMQFVGSDGSVIWATVLFPAAQVRGDVAYQAKTAYNGSSQGIGTVFNDGADTGSGAAYRVGLQGTVTIVEAFAESEINPGLITLIE